MSTRYVKNIYTQPVTIGDISTNGVTLNVNQFLDILPLSTTNSIAKSHDLEVAVNQNFILVYDDDKTLISSKKNAINYLRTGVNFDNIPSGSGTTDSGASSLVKILTYGGM